MVVDFTDPANPRHLGHYIAQAPHSDAWSSYWYRGSVYVNSHNSEGVRRLRIDDAALDRPVKLHHLNPQTMEAIRKR